MSGAVRGARNLLTHPITHASGLRAISLLAGVAGSVVIARLGGADVKGVASAYAAANVLAFIAVNLDIPQQLLRFAREQGDGSRTLGFMWRGVKGYILK